MLGIPETDYPRHPVFTGKGLVVCGGGRCVWEDMEGFCPHIRGGSFHIMAVNDVGMHIPLDVKHWYSNSPKELSAWKNARRPNYNTSILTHSLDSQNGGAKYKWPWPGHGTSSLNAVYTGLRMGYEQIVLCGVPLDDSGHYFDPPWIGSTFASQVPERDGTLKWWGRAAEELFGGRVKSMSGRTRDLLGAP